MSQGSRSTAVRLVKIRDLQSAPQANDPKCFSLLFQAPSAIDWSQQTYRFSHAKLGSVTLFATPVGNDPAARYYEVVVNNPPL